MPPGRVCGQCRLLLRWNISWAERVFITCQGVCGHNTTKETVSTKKIQWVQVVGRVASAEAEQTFSAPQMLEKHQRHHRSRSVTRCLCGFLEGLSRGEFLGFFPTRKFYVQVTRRQQKVGQLWYISSRSRGGLTDNNFAFVGGALGFHLYVQSAGGYALFCFLFESGFVCQLICFRGLLRA